MAARVLALSLCAACAMGSESGNAGAPPDAGATLAPTAEAQAWLDGQNLIRRNAQPPPPTPLPALTWSDDAAKVAQAWADGCVYQHDQNRGFRGENIAANAPPSSWTLQDVINAWASESKFYDYAGNTCASGQECGHYTQLVWRDTTRAGCAHRTCAVNSPFGAQFPQWEFWVCDYEPPGNWVGQRPY